MKKKEDKSCRKQADRFATLRRPQMHPHPQNAAGASVCIRNHLHLGGSKHAYHFGAARSGHQYSRRE